uniref:Rod shape-determining protein MreC n=1 Tax=Anisakis simplex TaxID=6269 RepID=A0A0M3J2J4_ANISI
LNQNENQNQKDSAKLSEELHPAATPQPAAATTPPAGTG